MSAPRFAACKCSHPKLDHEGALAPQCDAARCTCLQYRPVTAPDRPVAVTNTPPTAEQIIAAGKRSPFKRTAAFAAKVETQLDSLREVLRDERQVVEAKRKKEAEKQAARAEVELLERQLREAKARLSDRKAATTANEPKPPGDGICPDCGKDGLNNVGAHRSRAHGFKATA